VAAPVSASRQPGVLATQLVLRSHDLATVVEYHREKPTQIRLPAVNFDDDTGEPGIADIAAWRNLPSGEFTISTWRHLYGGAARKAL
jgi:hypothetical protein